MAGSAKFLIAHEVFWIASASDSDHMQVVSVRDKGLQHLVQNST